MGWSLAVGVFHDSARCSTNPARGEGLAGGAPLHLALTSCRQPPLPPMPFSLPEQPPHAESQPISILARVVAPRRIRHAGADHRGPIESRLPVRVVPGQATRVIRQNDADPAQRDRRDECLEAGALAVLTRLAEVGIHDMDRRGRPAEVERTWPERLLVALAVLVMGDLGGRRLTHIDIRLPFTVTDGHLVLCKCRQAAPPGSSAESCGAPGHAP